MSEVTGGYHNRTPDFMGPVRKFFDRRDQNLSENRKYTQQTQMMAQQHQNAAELMMYQHQLDRIRDQARFDHESGMQDKRFTFEGGQAMASRVHERGMSQDSFSNDMARMTAAADLERKSQNNQGRLSRLALRTAAKVAEGMSSGSSASGGGNSASAPKQPPRGNSTVRATMSGPTNRSGNASLPSRPPKSASGPAKTKKSSAQPKSTRRPQGPK